MPIPTTTLHGRHVRLEPLAESHREALAKQANDPVIWRFMPYARPDPRDALQAWYEFGKSEVARGGAIFAVIDLARGEPVGGTSFLDFVDRDRRVEIGGTWLGRLAWRTPVNTECKRLLLGHAFEELGLNRVQLKTDARNLQSQAAIERLGAQKEGALRRHMVMPDGHLRDTVMYSILATEWPAVKAGLDLKLAR